MEMGKKWNMIVNKKQFQFDNELKQMVVNEMRQRLEQNLGAEERKCQLY